MKPELRQRISSFIDRNKALFLLSYFAIYLPWFGHLEKTVTTHFHVIHTALDDYIPFCEYFIIPYFLWFAYIAAVILWFFFTNKEDYYRVCILLFTGMTLSLLICTLFPNGTDFRPYVDPEKNIFAKAVSLLYATDTCTNVFPSIHVYNSVAVHIGIIRSEQFKNNRIVRLISGVLMVSICMSTVFLKQHSIIDVAGALLLCGAVYPLVYAPGAQRSRENDQEGVLIR